VCLPVALGEVGNERVYGFDFFLCVGFEREKSGDLLEEGETADGKFFLVLFRIKEQSETGYDGNRKDCQGDDSSAGEGYFHRVQNVFYQNTVSCLGAFGKWRWSVVDMVMGISC